MNRLDRALAILLLLRSGKALSAATLAERFEVSTRTIYRDVETLSLVGVPVYAEMGRDGGFRLLEGYFLPPVMLTEGEAISLLLGLTALRRLRAKPFAAELETAEQKLLAAVSDHLRATLSKARQFIGFESHPTDAFSLERFPTEAGAEATNGDEGQVITTFLQAVLHKRTTALHYRSPYSPASSQAQVQPLGLLWDRDRWYLVGRREGRAEEPRLWRADRVLSLKLGEHHANHDGAFNVERLLNRRWLHAAMAQWTQEVPVVIRLTRPQAARLQQDWYYQHARFEDVSSAHALMTFGESNRELVFALLRWLGPEAELIEPRAWRAAMREELARMLAVYADSGPSFDVGSAEVQDDT